MLCNNLFFFHNDLSSAVILAHKTNSQLRSDRREGRQMLARSDVTLYFTSHRPWSELSLPPLPGTGDNRPLPALAHTTRPPWWWRLSAVDLSGVPLDRCRRPAAAACLYSRSSSHTKCDSSSWAVRSVAPHTGQHPAADDCCWPAAEDCCCFIEPLLLLLLLMLLLEVAVPVAGPPAPLAGDGVVTGGDGFFPAEQPKMSLKSKNGGRAADARRCCNAWAGCSADCRGICCRAVKSVIAWRTRTATNWLRRRRQQRIRARHVVLYAPSSAPQPTLATLRRLYLMYRVVTLIIRGRVAAGVRGSWRITLYPTGRGLDAASEYYVHE